MSGLPTGFDDREIERRYPNRRPLLEPSVKIALILAIAVLMGSFVVVGRYTAVRPAQGLFIYQVDRFTGTVRVCAAASGECRELGNAPDPWGVATVHGP